MRDRVKQRAYMLYWRYGITLEEWNAQFARQRRRCAVCSARIPGARSWATDHDHETGILRGILCHKCNVLLGRLGDNVDSVQQWASRIADYFALSKS